MSARINLLPHREERRKRGRQHFYILSGGTAILGLVIVGAMHVFVANKIDAQEERNKFLKAEITKLEKEISEINSLKDQIQALLARKNIIETLQADRAQTVHLLDELAKQTPDGVYLRSVAQKGTSLSVLGYAQSNAMVSTLMRNIEASQWLANPQLIEVKAATVDKKRLSDFTMTLALKRQAAEASKAPAKGAAKAAPKG
jgi:type IV pilus assembly protein PilN